MMILRKQILVYRLKTNEFFIRLFSIYIPKFDEKFKNSKKYKFVRFCKKIFDKDNFDKF